ncbi:MAG: ComF family protein [Ignavibacteriaceae bacterium]|nr:ComF family protein [Ignavibacteriaceae bacterium]
MAAGEVLRSFSQLFFPETCAGCAGKLTSSENFICSDCISSLSILTPEERLAEYKGRYETDKLIDAIYPLFGMMKDSAEIEIIHRVKYRNKQRMAVFLGRRHAEEIIDYYDCDILTPVPLHKLKKLERGYNQSELISRGISEVSGIPVVNALTKTKYTETQTHKSGFERRKNIYNTFVLSKGVSVEGKSVVLVDDVLTTGSTVSECARVLKENGASKVTVATLALTL